MAAALWLLWLSHIANAAFDANRPARANKNVYALSWQRSNLSRIFPPD